MNEIECLSPNDQRLLAAIPVTPLGPLRQWAAANADVVVPTSGRAAMLRSLSQAITTRKARLEHAIVHEGGKTADEAAAETEYAASFLDAACDVIEAESRVAADRLNSGIHHAPLGVALLIAAYNDPLAGITRKLGPAIAAGCPVIIKPSPLGAWCAQLLEDAVPEAMREYLRFAYLDSTDDAAQLISAPGIGVVSLTGSTKAGHAVGAIAGARAIPCIFELGGNCPLVVFADADLDRAAIDILDRKSRAAGQACSAVNRVLVDAQVMGALLERIEALLPKFSCGRSSDSAARFGPVRTLASRRRLRELELRCMADGGILVGRGADLAISDLCSTYPLTIIRSPRASPLDTEEAFGPLLNVRSFSGREELDRILSPARQNLAAYFYGKSTEEYLAQRPALRFGSIGIDTTRVQSPFVPTGGFWNAGYGREGGAWGVDAFRTTINLRRRN